MKAIILAAGQGTRLRPYTDEIPKCLVEIAGKSLLDYQLNILREAGVDDITIITGYREDKIKSDNVRKMINARYAETNMVKTLFCAENLMDGKDDIIISYGDIIYELSVLSALIACKKPICLTVDRSWKQYWKLRMDDPLSDAETLKINEGRITEIGKKPSSYDEIQGQFMGLLKIQASFIEQFKNTWKAMDPNLKYDGKDLDNVYMTSFIQHLINSGWNVAPVFVNNGWLEVDSCSDLNLYNKMYVEGSLDEFIKLPL